MDFTTQGGKIYRPRPKAEVSKFVPPRDVKSIDDRLPTFVNVIPI